MDFPKVVDPACTGSAACLSWWDQLTNEAVAGGSSCPQHHLKKKY